MNNFINKDYIQEVLENAKTDHEEVLKVLQKAALAGGLNHHEVAILLKNEDETLINVMHEMADKIKKEIYGDRVVLFAPLYISNYCTNNCYYCGYKRDNNFPRKKLSMEEIAQEVKSLEQIGHKRLALEVGEDQINTPIEYVCEAIKTIYASGDIRRVNVNVAATTVENYRKLKECEIGTYILFQETYDYETYKRMHPQSLKGDYERQLFAHHRAIEAGLDDVGGGVLFGLSDYKEEVMAMMLHNEELFKHFGVEFHTLSVPRLKHAEGMELTDFPHIISDDEFVKIVSIIRLACPHVGIILSTRETRKMRERLLKQGVSQISANSKTTVGGYTHDDEVAQFDVEDERSLLETMKDLIEAEHVPSYCTACYRMGRTGQEFHKHVETHKIAQMCHPNAILTTLEFVLDAHDEDLLAKALPLLVKQIDKIQDKNIQKKTKELFDRIHQGERDLFI